MDLSVNRNKRPDNRMASAPRPLPGEMMAERPTERTAMAIETPQAQSIVPAGQTARAVTLPRARSMEVREPIEPKMPSGFQGLLARTDSLLARTQLETLGTRWPVLPQGMGKWEEVLEKGRRQTALFRLQHLVFQPDEDPRERLKPFYLGLHSLPGSPAIFFVVDSLYDLTTRQTTVELYLGIRTHTHDTVASAEQFRAMAQGYFPGTDFSAELMGEEAEALQRRIMRGGRCEIACVSAVPSPKCDASGQPLMQGLESLVDVMLGHSYTAVLIAQAVRPEAVAMRRRLLENAYTELSPARQVSESHQTSTGRSLGLSFSQGESETTTEGTSVTNTSSFSQTVGKTETTGTSSGSSSSISGDGWSSGSSSGSSSSTSYSQSTTHGFSHSVGQSHSEAKGISVTRGVSDTRTTGETDGITLETTNKNVDALLGRLDEALKGMQEADSFGLWDCAAYFISDTATQALLAASTYKALVCGDASDGERAYLGLWDSAKGSVCYDKTGTSRQAALLSSILTGAHPMLCSGSRGYVMPTASVSGRALPYFLPLPLRSVPGVSVDRVAAFERSVLITSNIRPSTRKLRLGDVWHMGRRDGARGTQEEGSGHAVELDLDAFTGHCLVTGSTGSGKSNTVGVLLEGFVKAGIPFLAIEPAKGEYRNDFRWVRNADGSPLKVYSTHPCVGRLLRMNPFRFPESVHVLEHIDRLLSIFASCWEMSEAMPALLKKAVERAYATCGWNLLHSRCGAERKFPTFATLISALRKVIRESDYDERAKGTYTGALVTRVESLAGGLLGEIFCSTLEVSDEELFNVNCVVDLSRLGSGETKALLMGILVMALSEFRADEALRTGVRNRQLSHITVLEEAHNLLRNTETLPGGGGTMVSKAVESLGNAIAEMRTYGEGFLIVDQSPGALDICATRNTNTKIVMRLPEQQDCEAMTKALALDEWQGQEVAKLNPGVAVVFQNTWRSPVLVRVDRCPPHEAERQAIPEAISTPNAYWALQLEVARWLTAWGLCSETAQADVVRDRCLAWCEGDALREICEQVAPDIFDRRAALLRRQMPKGALMNVRERQTLFVVPEAPSPEAVQEAIPPLPLSEASLAEAKERLRHFFAYHGEVATSYRLGRELTELLGLQTLWREWLEMTRKARVKQDRRAARKELSGTMEALDLGRRAAELVPTEVNVPFRCVAWVMLYDIFAGGVITSGGSQAELKELRALYDLLVCKH